MPMPPMPPLQLSGSSGANGRQAGQTSSVFDMPFSFDNSGWNVSNRGSGMQTATGAQGQGGGLSVNPLLLVAALGAYFILRK